MKFAGPVHGSDDRLPRFPVFRMRGGRPVFMKTEDGESGPMTTPQGSGHGQIGHPPLWTHTDRKLVAALIWAGKSCREIGAELHLTRNATIGRIHRDPALAQILSRRGYPKRAPKPYPQPKPKPQLRIIVPKKPVAIVVTEDWGPWEEREAIRASNPKPLIKLRNHECRWPVLDAAHVVGGFLFCAEAVARDGGPYCPHHKQRARP